MAIVRKLGRILLFLLGLLATNPARADFSFVALGDMPYGDPAVTFPKYKALIGAVNAARPAFTIHVGDIKSGSSKCSDEAFAAQKDFLNSFAGALFYTPGDNEWTDCHRPKAGGYDPLERLAKLRAMFFAAPRSLGRAPMERTRQADAMPAFKTYVENARFIHDGAMVVLVHVVGSNNNLEARDPTATAEFFAREAADVAWLEDSFAIAQPRGVTAMVVAFHADPLESANVWTLFPSQSGFTKVIGRTLLPLAEKFAKPVLVIHGDSHLFRVDRPFFRERRGDPYANVTRLEVFGEQHMHAVQVTVHPGSRNAFSFTPIYNPMK